MSKRKSKTSTLKKLGLPKPLALLKKTPAAKGVSLGFEAGRGYFVYTHRAASKRYKSVMSIPKSVIEFIESTG